MKRWISLCLVSLIGCAADVTPPPAEATAAVAQSAPDCTPGGNYLDATLPPTPYFTGKGPSAGPTQVFVLYVDPSVQGEYVVYLADHAAGKLVWGARSKSATLSKLTGWLGGEPLITAVNPPPPPPPCPGCGDDFYARFTLELALRESALSAQAAAAAAIPKI